VPRDQKFQNPKYQVGIDKFRNAKLVGNSVQAEEPINEELVEDTEPHQTKPEEESEEVDSLLKWAKNLPDDVSQSNSFRKANKR